MPAWYVARACWSFCGGENIRALDTQSPEGWGGAARVGFSGKEKLIVEGLLSTEQGGDVEER